MQINLKDNLKNKLAKLDHAKLAKNAALLGILLPLRAVRSCAKIALYPLRLPIAIAKVITYPAPLPFIITKNLGQALFRSTPGR